MADTIAEQGAIRQGIQDALNGVTPNAQTTAGFANNVIRQYLNGTIRFDGNRQTPRGRIIGYMLDNNLFVDFGISGATLDSRITATRASTKTYFDSTGTLQVAAVDEFPLEYDPVTLQPVGRSIWESRTNSIRNNTMQGAAAPSTAPLSWGAIDGLGAAFNGITATIIGVGTEDGIEYIDIRWAGTPTASTGAIARFEGNTQVPAANGQVWTLATYVRLVAGSLTNVGSVTQFLGERDGAGASLVFSTSAFTPTSAALRTQRQTMVRTNNNASTAFELPALVVNFTNGNAIDLTLRIGLPQTEQGAFATPVIKTTVAAATRAADVMTMTGTNFSSWYNQNEGTLVADYIFGSVYATNPSVAVSLDDGTSANELALRTTTAHLAYSASGALGGSPLTNLNNGVVGSVLPNTVLKQAIAYKTGDSIMCGAGTLGTQSTVAFSGAAVTSMRIGRNRVDSAQLNGWIRSIKYYPSRLPNAQLQALTA